MITDALVVTSPGAPFKLQPIHVEDQLREDEVLIEIKATGICHTDLNFSKEETILGLFPAVFGHEGSLFPIFSMSLHGGHVLTTSSLLNTVLFFRVVD